MHSKIEEWIDLGRDRISPLVDQLKAKLGEEQDSDAFVRDPELIAELWPVVRLFNGLHGRRGGRLGERAA